MTSNNEVAQINAALHEAWEAGRDIDDQLARRIARQVGDEHDPLHALAETGAITAEALVVLTAAGEDPREPYGIWIAALMQYCQQHGPRGPVDGWSDEPKG